MYIYIYIYIHTYNITYIYIYTYTHTYTYTCIIYTHIISRMHTRACTHFCAYVHIHIACTLQAPHMRLARITHTRIMQTSVSPETRTTCAGLSSTGSEWTGVGRRDPGGSGPKSSTAAPRRLYTYDGFYFCLRNEYYIQIIRILPSSKHTFHYIIPLRKQSRNPHMGGGLARAPKPALLHSEHCATKGDGRCS